MKKLLLFALLSLIPAAAPAATTKVSPIQTVLCSAGSFVTQLDANGVLSCAGGTFTSGSIVYSNGTSLAQDNAHLFWDATNKRLGIGTAVPGYTLDVVGPVRSQGASAGYVFNDRTGAQAWQWYGTSSLARLHNGSGDVIVVDAAGNTTVNSLAAPNLYGGGSPSSSVTLQSTYSGSPSGDSATVQGSTINLRGWNGSQTTVNVGAAGLTGGQLVVAGGTSGAWTLKPPAAASGTLTFPAGTTDFSATGGANRAVMQTSAGGAFTVEAMLRPDASNATLPTARTNLGVYNGALTTGNLPVYFNGTGTTQDSGVAPKTSGAAYSLVGNPNSSPAGLQDISTAPVSWTPVDASGQGLTFVSASGFYTKVGRLCFVTFGVQYPPASDANPARITGLPATCTALTAGPVQSVAIGFANNSGGMTAFMANGDVYIQFNSIGDGNLTNSNMGGKTVDGSITVLTN